MEIPQTTSKDSSGKSRLSAFISKNSTESSPAAAARSSLLDADARDIDAGDARPEIGECEGTASLAAAVLEHGAAGRTASCSAKKRWLDAVTS